MAIIPVEIASSRLFVDEGFSGSSGLNITRVVSIPILSSE
jgi:hypothetical protein